MYWTVWPAGGDTGAPMTAASLPPRVRAYAALVLTAALWGSSAVTARGLLDGLTPAALSALRWIVVLAALAPFVWRDRAAIVRAYTHDFRSLAVFAAVGFAPQTYLCYLGLVGSSAINLGLLNSAIPVLIVAITAVLYHRRPRRLELTGLVLSLSGVAVIIARGQWSTIASLAFNGHDLVMLLCMGVWAYYTVRLARRDDGLAFPAFMFAAGVLGLAMIAPAVIVDAALGRQVMPAPSAWVGVAYLGVLPTLVAMLLFAHGVRQVGAVQAGFFTHLVPVFSAILAMLFLGERLHAFHAAGFALVAGGAILGCLRPDERLARRATA